MATISKHIELLYRIVYQGRGTSSSDLVKRSSRLADLLIERSLAAQFVQDVHLHGWSDVASDHSLTAVICYR